MGVGDELGEEWLVRWRGEVVEKPPWFLVCSCVGGGATVMMVLGEMSQRGSNPAITKGEFGL